MRGQRVLLLLLLLLLSCLRGSRAKRAPLGTVAPQRLPAREVRAGLASVPLPAPPADSTRSPAASAARPREPKGRVNFVVQRVSGVCGAGLDPSATRHFSVGTDLLIETQSDTGEKPKREFVFCPERATDGSRARVSLNTWRMCRAYAGCKPASADGEQARIELQCGKDHISLENVAGHTVLRGPFGDREVAPFPMQIAPPKYESRDAWVDC